MSDEIKNFREAVEKFDEIQSDLEVLKEQLDNNFTNYKNVSDTSTQTAEQLNKILQSVNTLQINAQSITESAIKKTEDATNSALLLKQKMSQYYSDEFSYTKKEFDKLTKTINDNIYNLQHTIASKIENAINDIDVSSVEQALTQNVRDINIEPIIEQIENLNTIIKRFSSTMDKASAQIEKIRKNIVGETNQITQSVKEHKKETIQELKELHKEREEIIAKLKAQKRSISRTMAMPKTYVAVLVVSLLVGLIGGGMFIKSLTDKPLVVTEKIYNLKEIREQMDRQGYIYINDVEKAAEKYDPREASIMNNIPIWVWIVLIVALLVLLPIGQKCEEKDNRW